jgi:hypothetical protein
MYWQCSQAAAVGLAFASVLWYCFTVAVYFTSDHGDAGDILNTNYLVVSH